MVESMAKEKGCTPSQLALAWVMAQGDFIFPIPGTKRIKYLEENVGALEVELTKKDLEVINEITSQNPVAGMRYPEPMMKSINL